MELSKDTNIVATCISWTFSVTCTYKTKINWMKEWTSSEIKSLTMLPEKIIVKSWKLTWMSVTKEILRISMLMLLINILRKRSIIKIIFLMLWPITLLLSSLTISLLHKCLPWSLTIILKDGFLKIILILWKGRKLLNIRNKSMILLSKDLLIFRVLRYWSNFSLKYPISR